jgi:hypothetical protein
LHLVLWLFPVSLMRILSIVDPAYHTLQTFCNFVVKWAKMLAIFFRQLLYDAAYDYRWMLNHSLIKAKIIDNWYGNPTSHVNTFSSSSKSHHSIAPLLSKIVWRNICGPKSCQFSSVCLQTCKYDPPYIRLQVNVVPQCHNTLQYVVSYVNFLENFAQTKYCSSNEKKKYNFL